MNEKSKAIIDFLKCDYMLFENEKDNMKLFNTWKNLSERGKQGGFIPLIIAPDETLLTMISDKESKEIILEKAKSINADDVFAMYYKEYYNKLDDGVVRGKHLEAVLKNV